MKISHKSKSREQRLKESTDIILKHPHRVCIYLEKLETCKTLPEY